MVFVKNMMVVAETYPGIGKLNTCMYNVLLDNKTIEANVTGFYRAK